MYNNISGFKTLGCDGLKDNMKRSTINFTDVKGGRASYRHTTIVEGEREDEQFYVAELKAQLLAEAPKLIDAANPTLAETRACKEYVKNTYCALVGDNVRYMRNALNNVASGTFAFLFSLGCFTHLLDLLCEDLAKIPELFLLLKSCMTLI
eukprot:gene734-1202_t